MIAIGVILFFSFVTIAKFYQAQIGELRKDLSVANSNYRAAIQRTSNLETDLDVCQIKAKLFDALQKK